MGGKDVAKRIRRINKGKKPNEPVYDPELLPSGSIIAVDVSTVLVPFVKSAEGSAQATSVPVQSVTSVQDKLEVIYLKKFAPYGHRIILVVDGNFAFKDEVVRHSRARTVERSKVQLTRLRNSDNFDPETIRAIRKAEKGTCKVTCDVVANAVQWTKRRPGVTSVTTFPHPTMHTLLLNASFEI